MTAYCGAAPTPDLLLARWNFDPALLVALAVGALVCAVALRGADRKRRLACAAAFAALAVAFVSPLCALTVALFSARVVHHLLMVAIAAPAFAAAFTSARAGALIGPFVAASLIFWAWHYPPVYDQTLRSSAFYWAMQLSLLFSAIWFWRGVFARPDAPMAQLVAILACASQMGLLGALLTFAPRALYAAHVGATDAFGLSSLEDQQLAGLIMWAPAMAPYLAIALLILRRLRFVDSVPT